MKILILLSLISISLCAWDPPFYTDCDKTWYKILIGNGTKTICEAGSIISSMASAIAGFNIQINNNDVTPKSLNKWLISHNGYIADDIYVWTTVSKLGFTFIGFDSTGAQAAVAFKSGKVVLINVMSDTNWALVTDVYLDGNNEYLVVMDPGYNYALYPFDDVDNVGIYIPPQNITKKIHSTNNVNDTRIIENLFLA